jgi:diaminohydroxyphosphoribosylaminopyrimidine deaminase/5-amino-6-(5-phosphoribosylamino)uracil reductase
MVESDDLFWMRRALAEAERGRGAVEPNPLVGAVVVREGRLLGVGHHERFGGPHAEVVALEAAGAGARGATLYVTLEPCCHQGKTPPCTEAVLGAGIRRVVAAMTDPFPQVDGGGFARLVAAGIAVESGLLDTEARRLNAPYLKRVATGRPYVIAKWAMTLDGKTATASGDSHWISGPRSRALVHELRGRMDAILVGIGTALADDPQLTARPPGPRRAARVVLDSAARLPPDGRLARTALEIPVWVAVTERASAARTAALAALGCDILNLPGNGPVPIVPLLDELGRRGVTNLLVEGGSHVLGAFLDAGQVDAVDVYVAPIICGGTGDFTSASGLGCPRMADALRLDGLAVSVIDGDVRLQGTIAHSRPPPKSP